MITAYGSTSISGFSRACRRTQPSPTPNWASRSACPPRQVSRRIQRLTQDAVIRRQVALLDPESLGLNVEAYVLVSLASYAKGVAEAFHKRMIGLAEVVECCALTGDSDYLLHLMARDLPSLSHLINEEASRSWRHRQRSLEHRPQSREAHHGTATARCAAMTLKPRSTKPMLQP